MAVYPFGTVLLSYILFDKEFRNRISDMWYVMLIARYVARSILLVEISNKEGFLAV